MKKEPKKSRKNKSFPALCPNARNTIKVISPLRQRKT
jgi:hypothetical protein